MKKIYSGFTFLLLSFISSAQISFQAGYGDTISDQGKAVIQTSSHGYCIVGASGQNNADSADIAVYIIDSLGGLSFSSKIGMIGDEFPAGVVETTDGGFIIVGTTHASSIDTLHTDIFALKISRLAGAVLWSKVYGGTADDEAYSIIKTPDDNYLILGSTKSYGSATKSALALKINDTGDQQWCNVNSTSSSSYFTCADITKDQNYIIGGGCSNGVDDDNYLVKMDPFGNIFWSKRYSTSGSDQINSIKATSDSGFIASGISTINTAGDTDQNVIKFDSTGGVTWSYNYGTAAYDRSSSIIETATNHFLVCGFSTVITPGSTINQMVIDEIDSTGNLLWANTYGDTAKSCEGSAIIYGLTDGYAAVGNSVAFSDPNGDVFFIKTDTSFSSGCFEFPIVFTRNTTNLADSSGSIAQAIFTNINEALDTLPINPYYDQYSQNCLIDNITAITNNNFLRIYPNPAENSIQIESKFEKATATVYDQLGRIILSKKDYFSGKTIDISTLDRGVYIFELKSENNFARSKFVKE